jgi:hypothetical protein
MKQLKMATFLAVTIFLTACSFVFDVVIVNDSDETIEISYKIGKKGGFDQPVTKSVADWKTQKSIRRFWTQEKSWQDLPETEYETNFETRERTIKIPSRQLVRIEHGNYDPISEERGNLIGITELKIVAADGEFFTKENCCSNNLKRTIIHS